MGTIRALVAAICLGASAGALAGTSAELTNHAPLIPAGADRHVDEIALTVFERSNPAALVQQGR